MKHFIRAMEGVVVPGGACLALTFQDRMQSQNLAGRRLLRGQARGGFLKRLANDDRFRQRRKRNAGDEDAPCLLSNVIDILVYELTLAKIKLAGSPA
jgi:hypothetical protein